MKNLSIIFILFFTIELSSQGHWTWWGETSAAAEPTVENLIADTKGTLETIGDDADWLLYAGGTVERSNEQAHTGSYSLKFVRGTAAAGYVMLAEGWLTTNLTIGLTYKLSGYAYPVTLGARLVWSANFENIMYITEPLNEWTYFEAIFVATSADQNFIYTPDQADFLFYGDDFRFEVVP
jgi:hypothetical protein